MKTVLVVDSSAHDRELISGLLRRGSDWKLVFAQNGPEALAELRQSAPDLVVTELESPEAGGLEFFSAVSEGMERIPIVLIAAHGNEQIAVQALQHGASSYVPKGRLADELFPTIQRVLSAAHEDQCLAQALEFMTHNACEFDLPNDPALALAVPRFLQRALDWMGICPDKSDRIRVGVALEESLINAIYHGNLELGSELRDENVEEYYRLAEQRRNLEPYCRRRIRIAARFSQDEAQYVISDDGPGFDFSRLPDPRLPENLLRTSGRGVLLIRTFMDEVHYNARGNEITLIKRRRSAQSACA
jgi:CheY-like chemotaxis protein